jgi:hypothetical protein
VNRKDKKQNRGEKIRRIRRKTESEWEDMEVEKSQEIAYITVTKKTIEKEELKRTEQKTKKSKEKKRKEKKRRQYKTKHNKFIIYRNGSLSLGDFIWCLLQPDELFITE